MRQNYKTVTSILIVLTSIFFAQTAFAQSIYEMPHAIESRVASGENLTGEKGKGGQPNGGCKGAATVPIKASET